MNEQIAVLERDDLVNTAREAITRFCKPRGAHDLPCTIFADAILEAIERNRFVVGRLDGKGNVHLLETKL